MGLFSRLTCAVVPVLLVVASARADAPAEIGEEIGDGEGWRDQVEG